MFFFTQKKKYTLEWVLLLFSLVIIIKKKLKPVKKKTRYKLYVTCVKTRMDPKLVGV
jgi:hypothetical protein